MSSIFICVNPLSLLHETKSWRQVYMKIMCRGINLDIILLFIKDL